MKPKCPYDCKCIRKIRGYCYANEDFACTAKTKAKDNLATLESLMIENSDVLKRLKYR